jgi:hypothetical protein
MQMEKGKSVNKLKTLGTTLECHNAAKKTGVLNCRHCRDPIHFIGGATKERQISLDAVQYAKHNTHCQFLNHENKLPYPNQLKKN